MKAVALAVAARKYLSIPGEDLKAFAGEYKKLTLEDRQDLVKWFEAIDVPISGTLHN